MMQLKDPSLFRQQAYINGQWCNADSGETCAVTNPATGETIGTVPKMGAAETAVSYTHLTLPTNREV